MLDQAVILAGGRGSRLAEHTGSMPKPMLDVGGRPFLEYIVEHLRCNGFRELIFTVGYLSQSIKNHFGDGSEFDIQINYIEENEPLGTGGALFSGMDLLHDEFLVLNGDTIFDFNIWDFYKNFQDSDALGAVATRTISDVSRYGCILMDGHFVSSFSEKEQTGEGRISSGCYIFRKDVIAKYAKPKCSIEEEIFPSMVLAKELFAKNYDGFFIDIGLPSTYESAQRLVPLWWRKPIVFFDRDGVINVDHGYVASTDKFDWVNGAISAIKSLNEAGYRVIVITNQAGIARGYYSTANFHRLMRWMIDRIRDGGANVDDYYYCPHHPVHGLGKYRQSCECRKPAPGMLLQALKKYPADVKQCFLVGDKPSDIDAAEAVGVKGIRYTGAESLDQFIEKNILNMKGIN